MLIYVIALLVVICYAVVAHRSGGNILVWPLAGLLSFFISYWAWIGLMRGVMPSDDQAVVVLILVGMLLGLVAAVVVLDLLLRGAVARRAEPVARPLPAITPPPRSRRRFWTAIGVALALAVTSVLLQIPETIRDEFVVGGMLPAALAGAAGGVILQRPLRALLLGVGLGFAYAVCYATGLSLIGKLPLRGGEAALGAFIGLPLLMILAAAPFGFLGAACARALRAIPVRSRWLGEEA